MAGARLQAAIQLFPEKEALIQRLSERSSQFRSLCSDLDDVCDKLASVDTDDERREYSRLFKELSIELSEWIGPPETPTDI